MLHTFMELVDNRCFARLHFREIKAHITDDDAKRLAIFRLRVHFRTAEQRFGRNAAGVQARAAELPFSTTAVFKPSCEARIAAT